MEPLLKFFPVVKVDDSTHTVWGVVTSETPDADGEICDYAFAKVQIKKWSDDAFQKTTAAGQEPSLGNMRVMHQLEIGGKAIQINFDDDAKKVWVGSTPANDDVWHLLKGGFLTAHSIGGSYAWKKPEGEYVRFGPTIGEISYVDKGANPDAGFSYVKADGSVELRKFAKPGPDEEKLLAKILTKEKKYLVPDGQHLPYTDDAGKPDHNLMGAAWAALHSNYRGHAYEGPGKEEAKAKLRALYHSEGIEPPSDKCAALYGELRRLEAATDAEMSTALKKLRLAIDDFEVKTTTATGGDTEMKPEQIKKCAEALGISEEDFKKLFAPADALDKAHKGLAGLHAHLEKAMDHHDKMCKAHEALASMHEQHSAHLEKCMKACKGVMGSDGESEKAFTALVDEFKKAATPTATPTPTPTPTPTATDDSVKKAELDAIIEKAVKAALDKTPADSRPAALYRVVRDAENSKAEAVNNSDPLPV